MSGETEARKREHIQTVLNEDVAAKGVTTGFERFFFEHCALPELDLDAVDLTVRVFGKTLRAPLLMSSMTGGTPRSRDINRRLAEAAQELGIAMGIGSQRAMIERPELAPTFQVRDLAPDILLFANLGAVQLNDGYGIDQARRAVEAIQADALFLHLNPLQEAVQAGGDRNWAGLLERIERLAAALEVPLVGKEVGNGVSGALAARLVECGMAGIDVAGAGGTSWSEVEAYRQPDPEVRRIAHSFADWGIPTAAALIDVVAAVPGTPVFASGGIRNGVDAAKAIRLGAVLAGTAAPVLDDATRGVEAVARRMRRMVEELRIAAFCAGAGDVAALTGTVLRRAGDWRQVPAARTVPPQPVPRAPKRRSGA